jgi:hypothetical protein
MKQTVSRAHVLPKRRLTFTGLHDVISQKKELFIPTIVRTSDPTHAQCLCTKKGKRAHLDFFHLYLLKLKELGYIDAFPLVSLHRLGTHLVSSPTGNVYFLLEVKTV